MIELLEKLRVGYDEIVKAVFHCEQEVGDISAEAEEIKAGPAKARARYNAAIDAGDRVAASSALDDIAAAWKRSSNLPDKNANLRAMIPTLYAQHEKIKRSAVELRKASEENIKRAEKTQKDIRNFEQALDGLGGLGGSISRLADMIPAKSDFIK